MSRQSNTRSGKFVASVSDASAILKDFELLRNANLTWQTPSDDFLKVSKQDDYKQMYDTAINHYDYNLILVDGSIFQFEEFENSDLRYAYIQAPYNYVPFEDFLLTFMNAEDIPKDSSDMMELKCTFENDYEQMLSEQGINCKVVYFRYDVDSVRYMPNIHSYAHLHIGISNDIRIPCASLLTPAAFVVFVIKQVYKVNWERCMAEKDSRSKILKLAKDKCLLGEDKWDEMERQELALV